MLPDKQNKMNIVVRERERSREKAGGRESEQDREWGTRRERERSYIDQSQKCNKQSYRITKELYLKMRLILYSSYYI